jgi:hypothetical protein
MKEITEIIYVADDGARFSDKEECLKYECELKECSQLKRTLKRIQELCNKREGCQDCPFAYGDSCGITGSDIIEDKNIFPWQWQVDRWGDWN